MNLDTLFEWEKCLLLWPNFRFFFFCNILFFDLMDDYYRFSRGMWNGILFTVFVLSGMMMMR